jgi:cellobiose phosphorylase
MRWSSVFRLRRREAAARGHSTVVRTAYTVVQRCSQRSAGEVVYLRDDDSGTIWSATPLPIREREPYIIRHGQGYSVFEHTSHGISQELLVFAPLDAPVKISLLRLRNRTAGNED